MKVAVKTLCDFSARTGDLDHSYTPSPSALEGIQGHRTVTGRRGAQYLSELVIEGECKGLIISGRADGYDRNQSLLEEIKTHRGDISRLNTGLNNLHWAQLKAYGALLCRQEKLTSITLRLVYYNLVNEEETHQTQVMDASSLWRYLEGLCSDYRSWATLEQRHRQSRDRALALLRFPFSDFRAGQRTLSESVYKAVRTGRTLLLEAPTGSGKTVGTIFPSLMAMPGQFLDRLFYLSCRNTGRTLAVEGFRQILDAQRESVPLRVLELCARDQACVHPDKACHGESCPLARGFYDRLGDARRAAMETTGILDISSIRNIAERFLICPYYLSQEVARWCDVVIGDVNHFFDFHAMLYALVRDNRWKTALLVDEAHNLIDRARSMYSASLSQQKLRFIKQQSPTQLAKPLASLERSWRRLTKNYLSERESDPLFLNEVPSELTGSLNRIVSAITDYLSENEADVHLQDLLFEAIGFLRLADLFDNHSICEIKQAERGKATLTIRNLIPSDFLAPRFNACQSSTLFSATLTPYHFYRDLLGLPANSAYIQVDSPFTGKQLGINICSGISTRLKDRNQSILPSVGRIIDRFRKFPANYLVYSSSYSYLDSLYSVFVQQAPDIPVNRQTAGDSETTRREFLASFMPGSAQVGFAVLGGAFSEGIDLPGERLKGVFILTLGLPPHDAFHEKLREKLQERFGQSYEYTYLYPGIRKVVQAAGRVIRTPQDRGIIELIDDRFSRPQVKKLLPKWWPEPAVV